MPTGVLDCMPSLSSDPEYQRPVASLDGGEGAPEHLIFGTNVDLQEGGVARNGAGAVREGQSAKSHL